MRRLAVQLAVLAAALAVGGTAASGPRSVLAIDWRGQSANLVRVDPLTLKRVDRRALALGRHEGGWGFSPDRTKLALARYEGGASVRLVELRTLRSLGTVSLGRGSAEFAFWPEPGRLIVAVADRGTLRFVTVDPVLRKVRSVRRVGGTLVWGTRAGADLVCLLAPAKGIGLARLALIGAEGVRVATLDRTRAGYQRDEQSETPVSEGHTPALAVDPVGRVAYVIGGGEPVAVVDLATLTVDYRKPSGTSRRTQAVAKSTNGPWRHARWLGRGLIALSGWDERAWVDAAGKLQSEAKLAGLSLIDVGTWSTRLVDHRVGDFSFGAGKLFAVVNDSDLDPSAVLAYDLDGRVLFRVEAWGPLNISRAVGPYLYVSNGGVRLSVVEISTGRVLRKVDGSLSLLAGDAIDN